MDEIQAKVTEIVKSCTETEDVQKVTTEADLSAIGMDSITFIRIVVALEEAFVIEVPDEYLLMTEMNTVEKMAKIVAEALTAKEKVGE